MTPELRERVWSTLDDLVRTHRTFSHTEAGWVLPAAELDRLAAIAERLRPRDPAQAHAWLFAEQLPETGGDPHDYESRREEVSRLRQAAVRAILEDGGPDAVTRFAVDVAQPGLLGDAAALVERHDLELAALSLLDSENEQKAWFATTYAWSTTSRRGLDWVREQIAQLSGRPLAQARVLQGVDDLRKAWSLLEPLGADVVAAYWKEFTYFGRGTAFPEAGIVAERLLEFGRPLAALDLLAMYARRGHASVSADLVANALETLVALPADHPEPQRVSAYEIGELLEFLRKESFDEARLASLEWRLLPAREFDARSPILERHLANDPAFFVELVSLVYKPREGEPAKAAPDHVIRTAYRLLREWSLVPGSTEPGQIEAAKLDAWLVEARRLLAEAKRLEVGDVHIGQVFAHAPADPDGASPHRAVRDAIQRIASSDLDDGFATEIINQRGPTMRGLLDGGAQELKLATSWKERADRVRDGWPRVAAIFDRTARSYEAEARMHDAESERIREGQDS